MSIRQLLSTWSDQLSQLSVDPQKPLQSSLRHLFVSVQSRYESLNEMKHPDQALCLLILLGILYHDQMQTILSSFASDSANELIEAIVGELGSIPIPLYDIQEDTFKQTNNEFVDAESQFKLIQDVILNPNKRLTFEQDLEEWKKQLSEKMLSTTLDFCRLLTPNENTAFSSRLSQSTQSIVPQFSEWLSSVDEEMMNEINSNHELLVNIDNMKQLTVDQRSTLFYVHECFYLGMKVHMKLNSSLYSEQMKNTFLKDDTFVAYIGDYVVCKKASSFDQRTYHKEIVHATMLKEEIVDIVDVPVVNTSLQIPNCPFIIITASTDDASTYHAYPWMENQGVFTGTLECTYKDDAYWITYTDDEDNEVFSFAPQQKGVFDIVPLKIEGFNQSIDFLRISRLVDMSFTDEKLSQLITQSIIMNELSLLSVKLNASSLFIDRFRDFFARIDVTTLKTGPSEVQPETMISDVPNEMIQQMLQAVQTSIQPVVQQTVSVSEPVKKKESNQMKMWIGLVVIVAVVIGGYYLYKKNKDKK